MKLWMIFPAMSLLVSCAPDFSECDDCSITIAEPTEGRQVSLQESLTVTVVESGFILDGEAIGGAPEEGRGHYHLYIDEETVATSAERTIPINLAARDIEPGFHVLRAVLVNNDHSSFEVPVEDIVEFEVIE